MAAKAGIQKYLKTLDSRIRGNDVKGRFKTFYETIKIEDLCQSLRSAIFMSGFFIIGFQWITRRIFLTQNTPKKTTQPLKREEETDGRYGFSQRTALS
jgi:hypothetical protein